MFKHWMEIVHNHDNSYRDWLFYWNVFLRESQLPQYVSMAKNSHLRNYVEVHSLSSDQVSLSVQLKTFSKFSGWTFKIFLLLNCIIVYFIYL